MPRQFRPRPVTADQYFRRRVSYQCSLLGTRGGAEPCPPCPPHCYATGGGEEEGQMSGYVAGSVRNRPRTELRIDLAINTRPVHSVCLLNEHVASSHGWAYRSAARRIERFRPTTVSMHLPAERGHRAKIVSVCLSVSCQ